MATGEFWATCVAHIIFLLDITGLKVKPLEPEVVANFIWTCISFPSALEKEMATHSSILAWRIPWTEEPGRLQSMGSQWVGLKGLGTHACTGLTGYLGGSSVIWEGFFWWHLSSFLTVLRNRAPSQGKNKQPRQALFLMLLLSADDTPAGPSLRGNSGELIDSH